MKTLTETQSRIFDFIREHIADMGYPPTRTDICRHFGYRSPNAAEDHLRALERKGVIAIVRKVSRGIRLVEAS
jgi:repressor LexA